MSTTPEFREGKVKDLAHGAAEFTAALVRECRGALPNCTNCAFHELHNDALGARLACTKYKQYPPPHIIVNACPGYGDRDGIPF